LRNDRTQAVRIRVDVEGDARQPAAPLRDEDVVNPDVLDTDIVSTPMRHPPDAPPGRPRSRRSRRRAIPSRIRNVVATRGNVSRRVGTRRHDAGWEPVASRRIRP
jgi:hypothetical protein